MDEYKEALRNLKDDDCHYPGLDCNDCKYHKADIFGYKWCKCTELSIEKIEELINNYETLQKNNSNWQTSFSYVSTEYGKLKDENKVLEKALEISIKTAYCKTSSEYCSDCKKCLLDKAKEELESDNANT